MGRAISSNLPEHPISSRDSGKSMGPVGGTSAENRGYKVGRMRGREGSCMIVMHKVCETTGAVWISHINYSEDLSSQRRLYIHQYI